MARYTHYITVPITGAVNVLIETDEPLEEGDEDKAMEMALDEFGRLDARFDVVVPEKHRADNTISLSEGWSMHKHLNRGNVCYAETPEMYWESEDSEGE